MNDMLTDQEAAEYLAANVRRLLAARGMSMRQLAAKTGETPMQISRIARGMYVPNFGAVLRIAEAFDVTVDVLSREPSNSAST